MVGSLTSTSTTHTEHALQPRKAPSVISSLSGTCSSALIRPFSLIHVLVKLLPFLLLKFVLTSSSPTHCSLAYILCARKEEQGSGGGGGESSEIVKANWKLCWVTCKRATYMAKDGWYFSPGSQTTAVWGLHDCLTSIPFLRVGILTPFLSFVLSLYICLLPESLFLKRSKIGPGEGIVLTLIKAIPERQMIRTNYSFPSVWLVVFANPCPLQKASKMLFFNIYLWGRAYYHCVCIGQKTGWGHHLIFCHVGPRNQTQVIKVGRKRLYLLSHLFFSPLQLDLIWD